jgi:glycosyltransferase involved in cell wall biosynthesis
MVWAKTPVAGLLNKLENIHRVPDPLVSVVIPTFDRESTIARAVQSAVDQTYSNTEVIVVDDGSRDGTENVLSRFENRIRVIRQQNAGASAARNTGISIARGEIVAFLDSDDWWLSTKLEAQVELLESLGPDVPCCLCNISLPHKPFGKETSFELADLHPRLDKGLWRNPTEILLTRFVLFNQAVAVRRDALIKVGNFDHAFRVLEDYDFALRLSILGDWAFVKEPLVSYGVGQANSLSSGCNVDKTIAPQAVIKVLEGLPKTGRFAEPAVQQLARRRFRDSYRNLRAARLGQSPSAAGRLFGRAWELYLRASAAFWRRTFGYPKMWVCEAQAAAGVRPPQTRLASPERCGHD